MPDQNDQDHRNQRNRDQDQQNQRDLDQERDYRDRENTHDHHDHDDHGAPAATASSNQSLILGIVLGAVVLLLLLLLISQQMGGSAPNKNDDLNVLKKEIATAKANLEAERARSGLQPAIGVKALSTKIKSDTDALANLVSGMQNELRDLRDVKKSLSALSRDNDSLRAQIASSGNAQSQLAGLQSRLNDAEARLATLREQLAKAPDPGVADELAQARTELQSLREQSAGMVDGARLASLQKLVAQLQPENDRFRLEIQRLRAEIDREKLFVTSENLSPRATALFAELVALEGKGPDEIQAPYQRFDKDLNSRVIGTIPFPVGKASIDPLQEDKIKTAIAQAPANSFFLVVGYASKVGEKAANSKLSSQRAVRIASVTNFLKQEDQEVQAVYLGETDRFSAEPGPNQTCELWEIRP